mmetsp:Transcript_5792/g.8053  ORF Transcript_5792/g.8053 Transcript_5792/m.8053 type:complete len:119 (-) Transcript_5792:85-441(-)
MYVIIHKKIILSRKDRPFGLQTSRYPYIQIFSHSILNNHIKVFKVAVGYGPLERVWKSSTALHRRSAKSTLSAVSMNHMAVFSARAINSLAPWSLATHRRISYDWPLSGFSQKHSRIK